MKRDRRHRVHVRLGDVFDDDWNVKFPCANGLVVRGRDKAPIIVHKGDRIDRSQMLVIFLRYLTGIDVVLKSFQLSKKNGGQNPTSVGAFISRPDDGQECKV